jgi:hypothetical protein
MRTCVNFTAAQVLAALRGEVVTVREAVKFPPRAHAPATDWITSVNPDGKDGWIAWGPLPVTDEQSRAAYPSGGGFKCPYGSIGNTLWVRETWYYDSHMHELTDGMPDAPDGRYLHRLVHRADSPDWQVYGGWKSPAVMPRWASRLNVTVQSVGVEQVDGGWEWVVQMVKA